MECNVAQHRCASISWKSFSLYIRTCVMRVFGWSCLSKHMVIWKGEPIMISQIIVHSLLAAFRRMFERARLALLNELLSITSRCYDNTIGISFISHLRLLQNKPFRYCSLNSPAESRLGRNIADMRSEGPQEELESMIRIAMFRCTQREK